MKWVFLFVVTLSSYCSAKTLPSFIKKCKRTDSVDELSKCIIERVISLTPYLIKGIPEMKLPPIEPLHIPKLEIQTTSTSAFGFHANLTDIKVYGCKDFKIKDLKFDLINKKILLNFILPHLYVETFYNFNGKILVLELVSKGIGYVNVSNIESKSLTNVEMETRNGKEYLIVQEDISLNINYTHSTLYFDNLFENNKELTEQTNKAINENTEAIGKELDPLIYKSVRQLFLGMVNPVFNEYSLEELFD